MARIEQQIAEAEGLAVDAPDDEIYGSSDESVGENASLEKWVL